MAALWSPWQPGWTGQFAYQPLAVQVADYNITVGDVDGLSPELADSLRDTVVTNPPSLFTATVSSAQFFESLRRAQVHIGTVRAVLDAADHVSVQGTSFMGVGAYAPPPELPTTATDWEYESSIGTVDSWAPITATAALGFFSDNSVPLAQLPLDLMSTTVADYVPAYPGAVVLGHVEADYDPDTAVAVGGGVRASGTASLTVTPRPLVTQRLILAAPWARAGTGHIPIGPIWTFADKTPSVFGPTGFTARTPRWRYKTTGPARTAYLRMTQRADGDGIHRHPRITRPAPRIGTQVTI